MEKPRIAVSGINGFVGQHLARELTSNNISVIGVGHDANLTTELADIVDEYYSADLIESWPEINNVQAVIHLAGLAAVGPSFDNPQRYISGNSSMVTNLCEYYLKQDTKPRVVIVSSGAIYDAGQSLPITENGKIGLTSPYAVSKVLTENQAAYYRGRGLECIVARPFNHIGPGQGPGFLVPDLYAQLKNIQATHLTSISVGNLATRRDYTDVRDIARAYKLLATAKELNYGLYNICTGISLAGSDILAAIQEATNIRGITPVVDQTKVRPTDIMEIYGDASRLHNDTGWQPEIKIEQTIKDFVNAQA
jgi:GDP-4-dehydro-6-deoxy-D-mannose reductase